MNSARTRQKSCSSSKSSTLQSAPLNQHSLRTLNAYKRTALISKHTWFTRLHPRSTIGMHYAVLGIQDLTAGIDDIKKQYNHLASALRSCPSVAVESALRLVNVASAVLSQPRLREAYDNQLFNSSEFLEYVSLSSSYSEATTQCNT